MHNEDSKKQASNLFLSSHNFKKPSDAIHLDWTKEGGTYFTMLDIICTIGWNLLVPAQPPRHVCQPSVRMGDVGVDRGAHVRVDVTVLGDMA
jgi:hypothetical protein